MKSERGTLVKLKDVCQRVTVGHVGPMADKYIDSGIPFLRSQNIQPYRLEMEDIKYIPESFHVELFKSALEPGDVVVVRTGYPGTACVIPHSFDKLNCADLVVIKPSDELNPFYLAAIFNSEWGRAKVAGSLVGVAQQHFNITVARELEMRLPSRPIQDRIVHIYTAYNDLIENNLRRIKVLEEMARSLYREWFVYFRYPSHEGVPLVDSPLGKIPKKWKVIKTGERFKTTLGGTPSRARNDYWENGTIPWINSGKVNDLRVLEPSACITEEALEHSSAKMMPVGTTVLAITGATLGQVSYLEIETSANQSVVGITDEKGMLAEWLYLTISENIQGIIQHASGGAQQHINKDIVNDVLLAVPDMNVSEKFVTIIRPVFGETRNLLLQNINLRNARDLLLPRLLSGRIPLEKKEAAV